MLIEGVRELYGAPVTVTDLRAGAALVVAGLMAKGVTEIYETSYIDRGYEAHRRKAARAGCGDPPRKDLTFPRRWEVVFSVRPQSL